MVVDDDRRVRVKTKDGEEPKHDHRALDFVRFDYRAANGNCQIVTSFTFFAPFLSLFLLIRTLFFLLFALYFLRQKKISYSHFLMILSFSQDQRDVGT